MIFEILVVLCGVFSLIVGFTGLNMPILLYAVAIYYVYYGLMCFPYPKGDRHKIGLAIGCIIFIAAGLIAGFLNSWWFIVIGMVFGYGINYLVELISLFIHE